MSSMRRSGSLVRGAVLTALALATEVDAQPLRTNAGSYFLFAMRSANVKDLDVLSSCNVGVNCARPNGNSSCGNASFENAILADGSQVAADVTRFTKPGASAFQVFANQLPNPDNVTLREPGPTPLALPLLGDLDGDGQSSCGAGCTPDFGDAAAFCHLPNPFPACDPGRSVTVASGGDCGGAPDTFQGNGRCDLQPGTYGALTVKNGASISFDGGTYAFCEIQLGKNAHAAVGAATRLDVRGDVNVNNGSTFGEQCGDFTVNAFGQGVVSFGRNLSVTGAFCAPERSLSLGHNNDLTGRFVADVITADSKNRGHCCGGLCACIDAFSPTTAGVGDTVSLTGGCSLTNVTEVRICGIPALITAQSDDEVQVTVPLGAAGSCPVEVDSSAGTFIHEVPLTVG